MRAARASRLPRSFGWHREDRLGSRLKLAGDALTLLGIIAAIYYWSFLTLNRGNPADALTYYGVRLDNLYGGWHLGGQESFQYSPAFAQLIGVVRALPVDAFVAVWRGISFVLLVWIAGPFTLPVMLLPPVASELNAGNVNIILAAAIAAGFRWPGLWCLVLLTKVTPAVGLLWFVFRREWRKLAIAIGTTAAIALVSFAIAPGQWFGWINLFIQHRGDSTASDPYFIALSIRLPASVVVIVVAALPRMRWLVPVASTMAAPNVYFPTQSMATGAIRVLRDQWTSPRSRRD